MISLKKLVPGRDGERGPILSVLLKQTYAISHSNKSVYSEEAQIPFYDADIYGKADSTFSESLLHESDLVAFKPKTDLLVSGAAWSPRICADPRA